MESKVGPAKSESNSWNTHSNKAARYAKQRAAEYEPFGSPFTLCKVGFVPIAWQRLTKSRVKCRMRLGSARLESWPGIPFQAAVRAVNAFDCH